VEKDHARYMREALKEAHRADSKGEVPVGAIVVCADRIIARAHNQTEQLTDATAHAEMLAVTMAANFLGSKYLTDCTLYVTLEPCVMCAGALYWAQLQGLVYGASDPQRGYSRLATPVLHPRTAISFGIYQEECSKLVLDFFTRIRNK
jgi:tRNA(adenine34) deaminase